MNDRNKRIKLLKNKNNSISFKNIDCADYSKFSKVFKNLSQMQLYIMPNLPSAPYSMFGHKEGWKTLQNNLQSTFNLISCIKDYKEDCHVIKLGTMGEYGTPNIDIEEGWLDVLHNKRKVKSFYIQDKHQAYIIPLKSWIQIYYGFM